MSSESESNLECQTTGIYIRTFISSDAADPSDSRGKHCISERVVLVSDIALSLPRRPSAFFSERSRNVRDPFSFGSFASYTVGLGVAKKEIVRATRERIGRRIYIRIYTQRRVATTAIVTWSCVMHDTAYWHTRTYIALLATRRNAVVE